MKFKPSELERLMKASYDKQMYDINDRFLIDRALSDDRVKVYTVYDIPMELVVVHRGSQDSYDWVDNLSYMKNSDLKQSKTYKMHKRRHEKAYKKYNGYYINVLGHSRGALYATQLHKDKLANQVITYNKPTNLSDIGSSFVDLVTNKKKDNTVTNIRTKNDLVSVGSNLLVKPPGKNITIASDSMNVLDEHKTDKLLNMNQELIGNGLFKKEIDFRKLRKHELKQFLKLNKKKVNLDVNLTGLTKKQLVEIVKLILEKNNM
jgi:hypothetical protein